MRICSTPQGRRLILSVCETPRLDGDKGRGPRFGHQRCFPWQWNVFSVELFLCGVSKGSGYSRNRKVLQTIWQHMAPAGAAAAASCTAAECCCLLPRQNIHNYVCARICNNSTSSISPWWRSDCADVAYVSFPLVLFFLITVLYFNANV